MARNNDKNAQLMTLIFRLLLKNPMAGIVALILAVGGYFFQHKTKAPKTPAPVVKVEQKTVPDAAPTVVQQDDTAVSFQGFPQAAQKEVQFLQNQAFSVGYSNQRGNPLWVVYKIHPIPVKLPPLERPTRFSTDKRVQNQVKHNDYNKSGYDRGHSAPNFAISALYGKQAQLETFLMTNITPQTPALNRKLWQRLEAAEISYFTKLAPTIWVTTGTIFDNNIETLKTAPNVEIPDAFFKVYAMQKDGKIYLLAFIMPQAVKGNEPLDKYLVSVDKVEALTGLDFFAALDDSTENALEAAVVPAPWKVSEVANLPSRY